MPKTTGVFSGWNRGLTQAIGETGPPNVGRGARFHRYRDAVPSGCRLHEQSMHAQAQELGRSKALEGKSAVGTDSKARKATWRGGLWLPTEITWNAVQNVARARGGE